MPALNRELIFNLANPQNARLDTSASSTLTIVDDDVPTISIDDVSVNERDSVATLKVVSTPPTERPVRISYTVKGGSATDGSDFVARTGEISLSGGEAIVTVPIVNDLTPETVEYFVVVLGAASEATLGRATAAVTIMDDDDATPRRRPVRR
jgi:hypothetical protein